MAVSITAPRRTQHLAAQEWVEPLALHLIDARFAHAVAHDLRSPLTAIQMCGDALACSDDEVMRRKYASVVVEQARAIAWSLEDLVALADEEMWTATAPQMVNLAEVVEACLADLHDAAVSRRLSVVCHPGDAPLWTEGCLTALTQAVRGCLLAVQGIAPSGADVIVRGACLGADQEQPAVVCLLVAAHVEGSGGMQQLDEAGLPWHRLGLLAAVRIALAHGGTISEVRELGCLGLRLTLPAGSD